MTRAFTFTIYVLVVLLTQVSLTSSPNYGSTGWSEDTFLKSCVPEFSKINVAISQATSCPLFVVLDSQEDVDMFSVTYEGCFDLPGDLYIYGDITNLNGLSEITSVAGLLYIGYSENLLNLDGLENLSFIGEELMIESNPVLSDISALGNVSGEVPWVSIFGNAALINLSGLEGIQMIGGSLNIQNNAILNSLTGLNNLNLLGGSLSISGNVALSDISALSNLSGSVSSLIISGNLISNLVGLGGLESLTGNLSIGNNLNLLNLSGLENLNTIQGNLLIVNSPLLNDISALNNVLGSISSIRIIGSSLSSINGLNGITHISGDLQITGINNLTSLSGLSNLNSIGGTLRIQNNQYLTSLEGLENLTVVTNGINISNNFSLSICNISMICDYLLNVTGSVNISNNALGCNSKVEIIERCIGLGCTSVSSPQNSSNFVATEATILWTEAYGATGYKMSIGTSPGGDQIMELTDLGNETEFQPASPFPFETQIFVKIFPYNDETELNNCAEISYTTSTELMPCPSLGLPADGANVHIANASSALTFFWSSVVPGLAYEFYLGTTLEDAVHINTIPGTTMTITQGMLDTLFVEKQTYYWFVVPISPNSDFSSCQTNARSFTLNCYNFNHSHIVSIRTDGDTETEMSAILNLDDVNVVVDLYNSTFDPAPFLSVDTFPGLYYPDINFIKSVPGKPTAGRLTRECIDGTMITLSSLFPATNFDYCSSCINYPTPEGPPVINPRCVVINQDQTINLTMKSAYHLPGNYDFDGVFPNNSTGVPTPGKELFFNFSPTETAHYGIQINEVSNNSYISYLFKEDDGVSACDPTGWTGLARVNGPMEFDIGTLEVGKTYKFVMAAEDTVSTRHSFILFKATELECPEDQEICISADPVVLQGDGQFSGSGVTDGNFNPSVAGEGVHEITYTLDGQSCSFFITGFGLPDITCPENQFICLNEDPFIITGESLPGGTYEGTGVIDADFDPVLAGPGAHIITYTFTDEQLCVNSCSFTFSVFDPADVICPDDIEACITSLSAIPLVVSGYPDGVFNGSGVTFAESGYFFNPSQADLGENTITFNALDQNGCAISCSFIAITIPGIELTDLPDQQYCNSSADDFLLSVPDDPDGVFSGPGVSLINNQYFFTPSVLTPGDYSLLFEATSSGCVVSGTFIITIIASENITCPPNMDVDPDNTLYLLSTPDYTQGIFNGPGVVIIDGFYYFDPMLAGGGTHTISYTAQDGNGCATSCSFQVFVNNEIPINCPDDLQFCTADNSLHLLFVAEYPLGEFSGSGVESNDGQYFFNPSLAGEGLHGISFSYTTNNGFNYFCDFTIIVVTEIPIACPGDFEVPFNSNINYPLSMVDYPDGIFEGLGVVFSDFAYSFQPGSANLGENIINFTANGMDGCLLTCSFIITTFEEDICPDIEASMTGDQLVCPSEEVWLTVNISGGAAPYLVDIQNPDAGTLTFTTEEEGESVFLIDNPLNGDYILVGVIDSNDCPVTVSGISQVSTEDTTPPIAICQDISVMPNNDGNFLFSTEDIDGGSFDDCGIEVLAIDFDWIDCTDAISTIVTLTVTDVSGNTSTCVSTVTPMGDSDCDGVGDACDLCPGGDDSIDNNGDGLPDCKYRPAYSQIIPEWKCGKNKVYVCKIPPGNPANAHTICVSYNAVNAHLNTGSFLGPCGSANCDEVYFTPLIDSSDEEVTEWRAGHGFEIYPNPTYGDFTVVFEPGTEEGELLVTDLHGKALVTYAIESDHQHVRLQLPEMPPGTYLVRHQNNQSLRIHKLMIIRN